MAKFVAMYTKPEDVEGFEDHYRNVHIPLCEKWPNVQSVDVVRATGTPRGSEPAYHLVTTVSWPDAGTMRDALRSEAGAEAAKDAMGMAKRFGVEVTMLLGEDF